MHQAFARRANPMGLVLIRTRQYEIRIGNTAELLISTWNDSLAEGSEVFLNARIQQDNEETQAICPTCSTEIKILGNEPWSTATWIPWCVRPVDLLSIKLTDHRSPHCPMQVSLSACEASPLGCRDEVPRFEEIDEAACPMVDTNIAATPGLDSPASCSHSSGPVFSLEFVLKHCKRVRFIAQSPTEYVRE